MTVLNAMDLAPELQAYAIQHSTAPDDLVVELIERTRAEFAEDAGMQVSPEQVTLLGILAGLAAPRQAVEVGTFTGMSALAIARALPPGGKLLCLDVSEEFTSVAREFWARAGVADRIELRIGPALDALTALPAQPCLDLAFIDADKPNYPRYWAEIVPRIRQGGLILVDNVLWKGRAMNPPADEPLAQVIAAFNDEVARDPRVDVVMVPIRDGLTVARKR